MNPLKNAFTLIVPNEPMSDSELEAMFRSYDELQKMQDSFLEGVTSFEDYIETAEAFDMDIDDYLEDIEVNLELADIL
jgi:hypothetical protein